MTEPDWLICAEPVRMVTFLRTRGAATERKKRLLAVACCRRVTHLLTDPRSRSAAEVAERYADGAADEGERAEAARAARQAVENAMFARRAGAPERLSLAARVAWFACGQPGEFVGDPALALLHACSLIARDPDSSLGSPERERGAQSAAIRDIFGNPFRHPPFELAWRTSTVVSLARGVYEERAFDRFPLLMDALMDAGCSNDEVLEHCRGPNNHVRGCWLIDLLLAKE
jgi:hypothetical protein